MCREKRHPYELLPISYPLYPWLAPKPEHKPSPFRLSDGQLNGSPLSSICPLCSFCVSLSPSVLLSLLVTQSAYAVHVLFVLISAGMQLKAAPDEVIMGQMRDWNEEVQTARELPVDTPQLKVFRDRTIHKVRTLCV